MPEHTEFNLEEFMVDSLCLNGNSLSPARPMFQQKDPLSKFIDDDPLKVLRELEFKEQKQTPEYEVGTPIQEFFRESNVFITGGTGFLGKVLTEKLLRSIPHIGHIYLLIRPKRGKICQGRFELLMDDKLFSRMKAEKPGYRSKITALAGDLSEEGLGLRVEDHQLLQESVHVVFHCAADVRFLEPLRKAIASNVLGSKRVMDLARNMMHLKAYVHVSTAFSQCVHKVIEEKVPKMNMNYKDILSYVESNTDRDIQDNLKRTLQEWPNTYTFSKAVCEDMIQEEANELPISIFRPSQVTPTYKEPVRGWTDNIIGPYGLMLGVTIGFLHIVSVNTDQVAEIVPIDYVINCMIALAWDTSLKRDQNHVKVINFTSSPENMLTFSKFIDKYIRLVEAWPPSFTLWFPSSICVDRLLAYKIGSFFLHTIPGHIIDSVSPIFGKKPRMMRIYNVLHKSNEILVYFILKFWDFKNDNLIELRKSLTPQDKELFNFDVRDINWLEYITVSWLGMRYYYLKDSMDSIPAAKRRLRWFKIAHYSLKAICGFVVLKMAVEIAHWLPL